MVLDILLPLFMFAAVFTAGLVVFGAYLDDYVGRHELRAPKQTVLAESLLLVPVIA
jgi:hypothetical protein